MRAYIREHLKPVVAITAAALIFCTGLAFAAPAIFAKLQPVLSDELKVVSFQTEDTVFEYTGKEIRPEISEITFQDNKFETKK